jgi:hypothetical protein
MWGSLFLPRADVLNSSLLLAFEQGSKVLPVDSTTTNCHSLALTSISSMLTEITNAVEPFILGTQSIDFDNLPPFIAIMVYKAAALVAERLWLDSGSTEGLRKLVILRKFLKMMGKRWLTCGKKGKGHGAVHLTN